MKKKLIIIFIFFTLVEYAFRTFLNPYKYHEVGLFLEFLPLIISTIIVSIYTKTIIKKSNLGLIYFQLITSSIGGLFFAKSILFFQWYWFIASEYRTITGDMNEGLAWDLLDLIIGGVVITLSYIVLIIFIKSANRIFHKTMFLF